MGVRRLRKDSVKALRAQKSRAELQTENRRLKKQVTTLEKRLKESGGGPVS